MPVTARELTARQSEFPSSACRPGRRGACPPIRTMMTDQSHGMHLGREEAAAPLHEDVEFNPLHNPFASLGLLGLCHTDAAWCRGLAGVAGQQPYSGSWVCQFDLDPCTSYPHCSALGTTCALPTTGASPIFPSSVQTPWLGLVGFSLAMAIRVADSTWL